MSKPQSILDIECYADYFLVMFMRLSDGEVKDPTKPIQITALVGDTLDVNLHIDFDLPHTGKKYRLNRVGHVKIVDAQAAPTIHIELSFSDATALVYDEERPPAY